MNRFALLTFLLLLSGCAAIEQFRCAPHEGAKAHPFSESLLTECLPTNTFWATHPVFCIGSDSTKPPVILLHELPGLSTETLHYAKSLSSDFSVYVPLLFGAPNQSSAWKGSVAFRTNGEWTARPELEGNSRIAKWLQHVTTQAQERHPGQPIGIIGNCLTGALPLALLDNRAVNAVVLAQPSLPLPILYYNHEDKYSLGISDRALSRSIARTDVPIYFTRFESDCISRPEKKITLSAHFGDRLLDSEIANCEYTNSGEVLPPKAHSTLIGEWHSTGVTAKVSENRRGEVRKFLKDPKTFQRRTPNCPTTAP
jgi:dienelactone hydrolase